MATAQHTDPASGGAENDTSLSDDIVGVARAADSAAGGVEAVAEVVGGFGAVAGKLSVERQARLDRSLDALEHLGHNYRREERVAHAQFHEVAGEVESAVKLFWQGLSDPDSVFGDKG